jgi:competence protein ComEA
MKRYLILSLVFMFVIGLFVSDAVSQTQKQAQEKQQSALKEAKASKVNINKATKEELAKLPGIGPTIAQDIVNFRDKNGPFKTIEDLKKVKGIGEKKFEGIKDLISVE